MLNFSEVGAQIRTAQRAKYKMLPVVLECFSRLQVKTFYQLQACTHISVVLFSGENFLSVTGMHTHFRCLVLHILVELLLVRVQIFTLLF